MKVDQEQLREFRSRALRHCTRGRLKEVARLLLTSPTASGDETALARALAQWGERTSADTVAGSGTAANWALQDIGPGRSNLVAWNRPGDWTGCGGLWFYTHLDHSLTGNPGYDWWLTGWDQPPTPSSVDDERVRGLGLAVSKGPATCAVVAYLALTSAAADLSIPLDLGLLLAAGGTHRARPPGALPEQPPGVDAGLGLGVEAALATGWRPQAVVNVKGGARGVLSAEPGCLLLQVMWRGPFTALPARGDRPGAAVVAGRIAVAVEAWREEYRKRRDPTGRVAGDLAVGAVRSGLQYKPDILPGLASVIVYLSTVPDSDPYEISAELENFLRARLVADGITDRDGELVVSVFGHHGAGSTPVTDAVVQAARKAWSDRFGDVPVDPPAYRGSTDGVIFRRSGIPTVRVGPTPRATPTDPTVEEITMEELQAYAMLYVDTVCNYIGIQK